MGLSRTGFILKMWKVGWMRMERGSCSFIAARLMTLWMAKGVINLGASFLDSTRRGGIEWRDTIPGRPDR